MAQYYQVTSLEELHRLYPNLQLDNLEGIPCMIQDDQVTQYTDGQGQQVIAAVEQSGMQLTQNQNVAQQCQPQSQFVVHQPTQYVIQQMETNESQTPGVQYIQQRPQIPQKQEEVSEMQFKDQNIGCIATDIGSEESSVQQCILKQDGSQQFIPQVQPILHQPIQIHQQIQAVDMGGNILVLQNQEQPDLILNQNKRQELISSQNQQDKHLQQQPQQQQQQQQQQHIIIQRHQPQKSPQIIHQRPQAVQKEEPTPQQYAPQQVVQNRRASQSGGQQQQIIHHPPQQIIQQLQYYNQVTVIDSFSQPNVTIEHQTPLNENLGQQQQVQQIQSQVQQPIQTQYKCKKNVQQMGIPTIIQQPQQVIIPQRFEMSSPPPLTSRNPQPKKKGNQQEIEASPAPVFIVQKLDTPFLIRQPQTKRYQNSEKGNETSFQSASTQRELNPENGAQPNQQMIQSQTRNVSQIDIQQQTVNVAGIPAQATKFPADRSQSCGQVKIGIMEQPFGNRIAEQMNKSKSVPNVARSPVVKIKTTEQQTDPTTGNDVKETPAHQFERLLGSMQVQSQAVPVPTPMQPATQSPVPNQIQLSGRGRGLRGAHTLLLPRGGHQYSPRARGVQVQTSPPRLPNAEESGIGRRLISPRGGGRGGRGGWVPCGPDQRQPSPIRAGGTQMPQACTPKPETSQVSNEPPEEARMVVLLLNGEKKMVRIPCSQQNILLNQILHQAGLQFTSPTSLAIEQVTDGNSEILIKNNAANNQQQPTTLKTSNITHAVAVPNSVVTPRSIVATIQQQRPRGQAPHLPQTSTVGIIRHRLHFASPRISSPGSSTPQAVTSQILVSEAGTPLSHTTQNSTPPIQPPKEEPRFVKGFMAICPFCGISSLDFNKCIRCRRKLPENVKSQSIFNAKKKKSDKATTGSEKTLEECKSESEEKQSDLSGVEGKEKTSPFQGYDKKKLKPCLKKKKINDEPAEILILSSDEEEGETQSKKSNLNPQPLSVLRKEPVYTENEISEAEMNDLNKESNLNEDLMKNVQPGFFTTLQCRTVRIGSYKVQPKERILVSSKGIRLVVNSLKNENASIVISLTNILKMLIHFGKQIPVIFIYPLPKVGFQIRNVLGMEDKTGPYYDPASTQEETHKRITLLLEKITEDNKVALGKIFGPGKLEELSEKEANEILIRASPLEVQNSGLSKATDNIRKIMVYPPPPEKGGITLNNQDYACLGEDQFLNDVIIDFYLKYLLLKVLSPEDRNRTHVFSTFFYKRLTTKPKTMRKNDPENDPKLSPAEKRHMRVKGWTKQVNLFEKDFIIVPINEHSHWFLAIICFPGLTGPVRFSDNTPVEPEEVVPKKNTQSVQIGNTTITQIIKSDGNSIGLEMDSASDRDEAEGDQDDLHPSSDDEESEQAEDDAGSQAVQIPLLAPLPQQQASVKETKSKPVKRKIVKEPIKQPCILIFDSLAGASRVRVVATLRDYLKIEYKKKLGQERDFSKDTIKGAVPKVPQQNNFTDCGLYVLQYVESFFQDPLPDFKLPLKYLQDWFPEEIVSCKRQKLACLIRSLMEEQGLKVEEMGLPVLTFTNGNNPTDDQSRMEEDEEEEDEEEMNEEEEEILRGRVHISEFDNEEDEEMELGEEEEDEEDEDELDDEDDDEELEVGEIPRRWLARSRGSCNELESPVKHVGGHVLIKASSLVDYEPSDSEEEEGQILSQNSEMTNTDTTSIANEEEYREAKQPLVSSENRKNVPLTELQDFESQISCTTIERNFDGKNSESDMAISEEEEEEEGSCEGVADEETSFESSGCANEDAASENHNQRVERRHFQSNEVLVKSGKGIEVSDIIQKLVNEKSITISRKEEELDSSLFKKQLDAKKFKVKDCDKSEESKKLANNLATCKRSYQALKSVRIPKKAERKLELINKRQKLDER